MTERGGEEGVFSASSDDIMGIWGIEQVVDQRYTAVVSELIFAAVIRNLSVMTSDIWANKSVQVQGHGSLPLSFAAAVFLSHRAYSRDDSL